MSPLERISGVARSAPISPVAGTGMRGVLATGRGADVAEFGSSAARSRLQGVHERTHFLHRSLSSVDAADSALERAQAIMGGARAAASAGGLDAAPLDGWLAAVDEEVGRPIVGSPEGLRKGATFSAADEVFELRPIATADLGAVVAGGRSYRLSDAGGLGSLDHRVNPTGALRSIDAAMSELGAARAELGSFRSGVLVPAQRDAMTLFRGGVDTGPATFEDTAPVAASLRAAASRAGFGALYGAHEPANVLALLS